MKYLEVEGAERPKAEGWRRRAARRGKEDRSPIRSDRSPMHDVFWFWSSSLRPDVMTDVLAALLKAEAPSVGCCR